MNLGQALHSNLIQTGLRELNPDIAFDVLVNRPSDWVGAMQFADPRYHETILKNRLPVLYRDRYICGMDRGMVPEIKQWSVAKDEETLIPASWSEADREDVSLHFRAIYPNDPDYGEAAEKARGGKDPAFEFRHDGAVVNFTPMKPAPVRGACVKLGWRHTLWRIMQADIPGITAQTLGQKFGVDMLKYPVGSPEELGAALWEE